MEVNDSNEVHGFYYLGDHFSNKVHVVLWANPDKPTEDHTHNILIPKRTAP